METAADELKKPFQMMVPAWARAIAKANNANVDFMSVSNRDDGVPSWRDNSRHSLALCCGEAPRCAVLRRRRNTQRSFRNANAIMFRGGERSSGKIVGMKLGALLYCMTSSSAEKSTRKERSDASRSPHRCCSYRKVEQSWPNENKPYIH